jgi:hypothetical protein
VNRSLPQPCRPRWQPLRAGLADLFYYDAEEFWFRDGRLLLRGNNGTGKSKVLALTLPFLLDGDLSAHRVEPDADPKKRMEWNLLLGGDHPYPERLGYTWLELGRVREDGACEFRTIGCGLKAVAGRGIARHWFFMTSQRVGVDLALIDATGTAVTRDRLAEALAGHGTVYDKARAYRRAVDEALFGLGEQRYGALVDLLIQLRQPQLSKRPSERALSDALTEALPPLDQAVVADVAEAFRSLEEDREALATMDEARRAAQSFLGHYRRYARIASRRRAALPRRAQSAYEAINRDLTDAHAAFATAEEALLAAEAALSELDQERGRLRAREDALRTGQDAQDARRLHEVRQEAGRSAADAERSAADRDAAAGQLASRQAKAAAAASRLGAAEDAARTVRQAAAQAAVGAGVGRAHADSIDARIGARIDAGGPPVATLEQHHAGLRREAEQIADRQQRAVAHVEGLLRAADDAQRAVAEARRKLDELESHAAELADRRRAADQAVAERAAAHVAAMRAHLDALTELRVGDPAAVLAALGLWVETLDGPNPARTEIDAAGHAAAAELARVEAALEQRHDLARRRRAELAAEVARLEAGEDTAPPVPHTRDPAWRAGRPGAPLWELVDFAERVSAADRAGIEAALEAAGILDAWVTPTGELVAAGTDDVVLRALPAARRPQRALAEALQPAVDRGDPRSDPVSDETVWAVLASIGLGDGGDGDGGAGDGDGGAGDGDSGGGEGDGEDGGAGSGTWVGADGRFRIGVLHGSWAKPAAEYIGRGARAAARRARLAQLHLELSGVDEELAAVASGRERLAGRRGVLAAELAGGPDDEDLRRAHAAVAALTGERDRLAVRTDQARQGLAAATTRADRAQEALTGGAAELGLPADRTDLGRVGEALSGYRLALAGLWPALHAAAEARRRDAEAREDAGLAERELAVRQEHAAEVQQRAAALDERYRTLAETVGAAVAELQRRLAEAAEQLRGNEQARRRADAQRVADAADRGRAEGRREELAAKLESATAERAAAAEAMRRFAATGLLTVALAELELPGPEQPWAPNPTVRLARQIDRELADVPDDDPTWDRAQRRVTDELKTLTDTLARQGNTASAQLLEDGVVVEVVFRGRPATVPELADALEAEVGERQRLLDEREREILENHLVNEVASTLQELISDAEAQVALMNAELAERPTSTGMRLRLLWQPREDGPDGLAAARERLLRQAADAWSAGDRAAVGGFLQARIAEVRSRNAAGTWLEHLTEALDYRGWNRFVIQRHQNGQWRSATGPASGGERVLAASVPLFAAASAHYASAGNPHAPRLVTLDEAFAGVDDNARAKYLGLLAAFDLDVVMTSEREWGCYPEVPGLAIAQLSRTDGVAAVLVTSWEWDGRQRTRRDRPLAQVGETGPPAGGPASSPAGSANGSADGQPAGTAAGPAASQPPAAVAGAQEGLWGEH